MAELTAAKRKRIPRSEFGVPSKAGTPEQKAQSGNYPMPDKAHARAAKSRASEMYHKGRISRSEYEQINRRADRVLYGGQHPQAGHVYLVDDGGKEAPKPDGQPSYKMRPTGPTGRRRSAQSAKKTR